MICATCLAIAYGSEESKDRLIARQAAQIDRLTGGNLDTTAKLRAHVLGEGHLAPIQFGRSCTDVDPAAEEALLTLLGHDDIYRKPPRVAAPKLVSRLADAGWVLVRQKESA